MLSALPRRDGLLLCADVSPGSKREPGRPVMLVAGENCGLALGAHGQSLGLGALGFETEFRATVTSSDPYYNSESGWRSGVAVPRAAGEPDLSLRTEEDALAGRWCSRGGRSIPVVTSAQSISLSGAPQG